MKTMRARLTGVAGVLAMALLTASAGAQCLSAAGWKSGPVVRPMMSQPAANGVRLMRAAYRADDDDHGEGQKSIVGMWHVHLVSGSVSGATGVPVPPPGVEIDAGFQQWHSDGTEMLNSGRPAANSNFCMGVWEQVGPRTYRLNHFAISYTQGPAPNAESGPSNSLVGPTSIVEEVTVSPDGKTFTGTFTITDYKETDPPNSSAPKITWQDTISGHVTGTRIDVNTPVSPVF
jgi:hypothetical protein